MVGLLNSASQYAELKKYLKDFQATQERVKTDPASYAGYFNGRTPNPNSIAAINTIMANERSRKNPQKEYEKLSAMVTASNAVAGSAGDDPAGLATLNDVDCSFYCFSKELGDIVDAKKAGHGSKLKNEKAFSNSKLEEAQKNVLSKEQALADAKKAKSKARRKLWGKRALFLLSLLVPLAGLGLGVGAGFLLNAMVPFISSVYVAIGAGLAIGAGTCAITSFLMSKVVVKTANAVGKAKGEVKASEKKIKKCKEALKTSEKEYATLRRYAVGLLKGYEYEPGFMEMDGEKAFEERKKATAGSPSAEATNEAGEEKASSQKGGMVPPAQRRVYEPVAIQKAEENEPEREPERIVVPPAKSDEREEQKTREPEKVASSPKNVFGGAIEGKGEEEHEKPTERAEEKRVVRENAGDVDLDNYTKFEDKGSESAINLDNYTKFEDKGSERVEDGKEDNLPKGMPEKPQDSKTLEGETHETSERAEGSVASENSDASNKQPEPKGAEVKAAAGKMPLNEDEIEGFTHEEENRITDLFDGEQQPESEKAEGETQAKAQGDENINDDDKQVNEMAKELDVELFGANRGDVKTEERADNAGKTDNVKTQRVENSTASNSPATLAPEANAQLEEKSKKPLVSVSEKGQDKTAAPVKPSEPSESKASASTQAQPQAENSQASSLNNNRKDNVGHEKASAQNEETEALVNLLNNYEKDRFAESMGYERDYRYGDLYFPTDNPGNLKDSEKFNETMQRFEQQNRQETSSNSKATELSDEEIANADIFVGQVKSGAVKFNGKNAQEAKNEANPQAKAEAIAKEQPVKLDNKQNSQPTTDRVENNPILKTENAANAQAQEGNLETKPENAGKKRSARTRATSLKGFMKANAAESKGENSASRQPVTDETVRTPVANRQEPSAEQTTDASAVMQQVQNAIVNNVIERREASNARNAAAVEQTEVPDVNKAAADEQNEVSNARNATSSEQRATSNTHNATIGEQREVSNARNADEDAYQNEEQLQPEETIEEAAAPMAKSTAHKTQKNATKTEQARKEKMRKGAIERLLEKGSDATADDIFETMNYVVEENYRGDFSEIVPADFMRLKNIIDSQFERAKEIKKQGNLTNDEEEFVARVNYSKAICNYYGLFIPRMYADGIRVIEPIDPKLMHEDNKELDYSELAKKKKALRFKKEAFEGLYELASLSKENRRATTQVVSEGLEHFAEQVETTDRQIARVNAAIEQKELNMMGYVSSQITKAMNSPEKNFNFTKQERDVAFVTSERLLDKYQSEVSKKKYDKKPYREERERLEREIRYLEDCSCKIEAYELYKKLNYQTAEEIEYALIFEDCNSDTLEVLEALFKTKESANTPKSKVVHAQLEMTNRFERFQEEKVKNEPIFEKIAEFEERKKQATSSREKAIIENEVEDIKDFYLGEYKNLEMLVKEDMRLQTSVILTREANAIMKVADKHAGKGISQDTNVKEANKLLDDIHYASVQTDEQYLANGTNNFEVFEDVKNTAIQIDNLVKGAGKRRKNQVEEHYTDAQREELQRKFGISATYTKAPKNLAKNAQPLADKSLGLNDDEPEMER